MIPTLLDIIRGLLDGTMSHEAARAYLAEHERLQAHVDNMDVPRYEVAASVLNMITRVKEQDLRWGFRAYPSFNLAMVSSADTSVAGLANTHGVLTPDKAKWLRETRAGDGELSWMDVLTCEVAKLIGKYEDQQALREQLLDVGAVTMSWAAQLTKVEVVTNEFDDRSSKFEHEGPGDNPDDPT